MYLRVGGIVGLGMMGCSSAGGACSNVLCVCSYSPRPVKKFKVQVRVVCFIVLLVFNPMCVCL